jgi:tetratricopeptide (TPR) repeat protein
MVMETSRGDSPLARLLLVSGPDAERLRRRCAAIGAAVAFVLCLFVVLGLAQLAFFALGALLVLAGALVVHRRGWDRLVLGGIESRARQARSITVRRERPRVRRAVPADSAAVWPSRISSLATSDDADATVEMAAVAPAGEDRPVAAPTRPPRRAHLARTSSRLLAALRGPVRAVLSAAPATAASSPASLEEEGSRCNALGVELRRAGRVQQAATLHEAARLIYEEVGDRRGEALAANALGVALAEMADDDAALEQFERARTLLHEIGDRQWEGKVLANLGFAKHRVGRDDEAVDVLRSALAKLSPETEAYQRVEQRLRRAS